MGSHKLNCVELNLSASEELRVELSLAGFRTLVPWGLGTKDIGLSHPPPAIIMQAMYGRNM